MRQVEVGIYHEAGRGGYLTWATYIMMLKLTAFLSRSLDLLPIVFQLFPVRYQFVVE